MRSHCIFFFLCFVEISSLMQFIIVAATAAAAVVLFTAYRIVGRFFIMNLCSLVSILKTDNVAYEPKRSVYCRCTRKTVFFMLRFWLMKTLLEVLPNKFADNNLIRISWKSILMRLIGNKFPEILTIFNEIQLFHDSSAWNDTFWRYFTAYFCSSQFASTSYRTHKPLRTLTHFQLR